ncbi:MAG: class I SAM-dependent methyltransferase [Candidatus Omnitrophota bacterium]|nr:class I SAM-dependent methyltransferase [Candidatus Omnitrophota bacterium]
MLKERNLKEEKVIQWDKCNLCGYDDFTLLFSSHNYLIPSSSVFNLVKCNRCQLVFLNPHPKNLIDYYSKDIYKKITKNDIFDFLNPDRSKLIIRFKSGGRVLDIGFGRGEFLFEMENSGWEVFGNELSHDLYVYTKAEFKIKSLYNSDLLYIDLPESFFDVITLWHVLEHLDSPLETLKKINKILKDNGVVIIESPDFASCQRKFFKGKWYALNIPLHIHHFHPQSLKKILNSAGLTIIKKDYFVNPRIDFITLKRSLLRYLHLELVPDAKGRNESVILLGLKKYKILFKLLRLIYECFCLIISLFLSLINCGSCFRLYCRKIKSL